MNKTISKYLERNILYPALVEEEADPRLGIIVVIPCYNEPSVEDSIQAIANSQRPTSAVEVLVSINAGTHDSSEVREVNLNSYHTLLDMQSKMPEWINIHPLLNQNLQPKKAGVGLGRKIGMDEAVRRFCEIDRPNGIIVCFDADSRCDGNYLVAIEDHFSQAKVASASIQFEHPLEGKTFSDNIYSSIAQYELHLRYFILHQKMLGLPYAYHTVGSSMACTVEAYCAVGGMNQKKAGEDFYFIHKLVKYGKHSELNTTRVIPSPRISDRVPFGTGKAVGELQEADDKLFYTYHPHAFTDLASLIRALPSIYEQRSFGNLPTSVASFLESVDGQMQLNRIFEHTANYTTFQKKFWHWFDAFLLMKYVHFARDRYYPNLPVLEAVNNTLNKTFTTAKEALIFLRMVEGNFKKD